MDTAVVNAGSFHFPVRELDGFFVGELDESVAQGVAGDFILDYLDRADGAEPLEDQTQVFFLGYGVQFGDEEHFVAGLDLC
ncbi:hypothetical protein OGAPHI_005131 [Ogataea philodendri]|uniref:Uncharacterized protein n=1 Tax=Ogataea philodendri TaxID=1378263 RepID=A0A9P8P276_9ASCO|nr:uncharacterized protein OGAPHI_005131 [Ogataea philodendri]KAH3663729.1 hypothetical protein OGAPHI_005131 [Ogataea philodendri]